MSDAQKLAERVVCTKDSTTRRLGFYRVIVTNQDDVVVAVFKGTVYKTDKSHGMSA